MIKSVDNYLSNSFFIGNRGIYVDTRYMLDCKCFETMVFRAFKLPDDKVDYDPDEYDMARYDTWSEAEKGHKELYDKWVKIVKKVPNADLTYAERAVLGPYYGEESL